MKMKRFFSVFLTTAIIASMSLALCSCSRNEKSKASAKKPRIKTESVTESEPTDTTPEPQVSPDPTDTSESTDETLSKGSEITSSYDCEVETLAPHEVPDYVYQEITIEDTEILNQEGLSVHVYGFKLGTGTNRSLLMRVDNQTGHPVKLDLQKMKVDGFCEIPMWMMEFENGTTTECELEFFLTVGDYIGLWNPGKIELLFEVKYTDTESTYKTALLPVYTSAYDETKTYEFPYALVIYDADGVKISVLEYELTKRGDAYLRFIIENNSDKEIVVREEESLINGVPVELSMFDMMDPGDKAITYTSILASKLSDAKITQIKTIGMILSIEFDHDYNTQIKTEPFTISVE